MSISWPPFQTPEQLSATLELASDWSLAHGLVLRPPAQDSVISKTSTIHGPYTLFPSPFPAELFNQAKSVQPLFNALYCHIAVNDEFLERVVGEGVAKVDAFQAGLYKIWKEVKDSELGQELELGLCRSDYLIHQKGGDGGKKELKQVEFNTISSSFGALGTRVTELHRHLLKAGVYPEHEFLKLENLPINNALKGLSAGLAAAHKAYNAPTAKILMVVQENERNAFDQRLIEFELLETHGLHCLRLPFSQLHEYTTLHSTTSTLLISHPSFQSSPIEISVVYFRAGYTPDDYPTSTQWDLRLLIEKSKAIKCPSVGLQLAGSKKVQQVSAQAEVLAQFLNIGITQSTLEPAPKVILTKEDERKIRESFVGLYPMDDTEAGSAAEKLVRADSSGFVLKPQREGGGNNIYRDDIIPFLDVLAAGDTKREQAEGKEGLVKGKEGYILMDLIESPKGANQIMVKSGRGVGDTVEVVSELGIYGIILFKKSKNGAEILLNETVGHLLRTKGSNDDEGGVQVGFSVIDSMCLI